MACISHSSIDSLLKERGIILLDADDVPEAEDTNDLDVFLRYEGLLALALLSINKTPKALVKSQIRNLVSDMDLAVVSLSEQRRIINGFEEALSNYKAAVVPAQQKLLNDRMTRMAERTQTNVAREILKERVKVEREIERQVIKSLPTPKPTPAPVFAPPPKPPSAPNLPALIPTPRQRPTFTTTQTTSWNQQTIRWTAKDTVAMKYLSDSQALYAGKFIDTNLIDRARNIIARDYSLYGDNPAKVSQLIKDGLVEMIDVTDNYWRTVATNALANARSYANLRAFADEGVHSFLFVAVMDIRTSQICSSLNGRTFPVKPALDRMEKAMVAQDIETLDKFTPMVRTLPGKEIQFSAQGKTFGPDASDDFLLAEGIIIPPLHFLCRSTIKPQY